jgi:hypothetical protein
MGILLIVTVALFSISLTMFLSYLVISKLESKIELYENELGTVNTFIAVPSFQDISYWKENGLIEDSDIFRNYSNEENTVNDLPKGK